MTGGAAKKDIALVIDWKHDGAAAGLRRNQAGFGRIKDLVTQAGSEKPLRLNAFFYAFLCPAKNFDLFLSEDFADISEPIHAIDDKLRELSAFEREARQPASKDLRKTYLELRPVIARPTARDERRTLATLLFSGPSTAAQVAKELGIPANLVLRIFLALDPVLYRRDAERVVLRTDHNSLAVVLYLLRSTLGVDPLSVLKHRITELQGKAAQG